MKYRHDPEHSDKPILEASPLEIDAHRDSLRHYLRSSWKLDGADVEDAAQDVVIIACRLIAEGRVRGSYGITPENRLRSVLRVITCNVARNLKRARRNRALLIVNDPSAVEFVPDAHSPTDMQLETLETLKAVCDDDAKCVRMLLRVAMGDAPAEIARETGKHGSTIHSTIQRGRNKVLKKHRNAPR